jgi:hypothetical protein
MAVVLVVFTFIKDLLAQVDRFGSRLIKRDVKSFFQRNKSAIIKVTTIALAITGISYFRPRQNFVLPYSEHCEFPADDKSWPDHQDIKYDSINLKQSGSLVDDLINQINQNKKLDSNLINRILKIKGLLRSGPKFDIKLSDLIIRLINQNEELDSNLIDKISKIKDLLIYSPKIIIDDDLSDLIIKLINQNEKLDYSLINMILKIKALIKFPKKLNNELSGLINQDEVLDPNLINKISKIEIILNLDKGA